MANSDAFEELAQKVQVLWLEACRARLERLAESWDPWIRAMLTEPLPDDWLAEIDRFVENTRRSIGLVIAPHSIGQIEDLIRDRAGGTGVFAAIGPAPVQGSDSEHDADSPQRSPPRSVATRKAVSGIGGDGAFLQRIVPAASGPADDASPVADLVAPDGYRDAQGNFMQPAKVLNFRRGLVNGTIYVFFRREPNDQWYAVREKRVEVFQNGRSLGLKWDLRGAKLVVGPAAVGLNHPPELGWAIIFRRLARDLLPADPEKFLAAVLERGEITGPLTEYGKQYAIELLKSVLWGMLIGMGTKAAGQWLDRLVEKLIRRAKRKARKANRKIAGPTAGSQTGQATSVGEMSADEPAEGLGETKPQQTRRAKQATGDLFNRLRKNKYPYNEVSIEKPAGKKSSPKKKPYILDSYDPDKGEIVSRKATQLARIKESSGIDYIREVRRKYNDGSKIATVPSNHPNIRGSRLRGAMILEVPIQTDPVPERVLKAATKAGVRIRDVNGKVYNP